MNPHQQSKLSQRQKEQAAARVHDKHSTPSTVTEFDGPEDLLRQDAAQVSVPDSIAERLQESIRQEPPRPGSWWKRMFGAK